MVADEGTTDPLPEGATVEISKLTCEEYVQRYVQFLGKATNHLFSDAKSTSTLGLLINLLQASLFDLK